MLKKILLCAALVCGFHAPSLAAELSTLAIMQEDMYPKAFFFRIPERVGLNEKISLQKWNKDFSQLMGIMGKVRNEEILDITERGSLAFQQFKKDHPDQLVIAHYNGDARDPHGDISKFFSGHWLYYDGAAVTSDIPAEAGVMEIHVDHPERFKTGVGRYGKSNEDIGLCVLDKEGKPDWLRSEQVQLISVNHPQKTLTVKRGQYGTRPRSFLAGKAYAAAHMHTGPFGNSTNLLWRYNYSSTGPVDSNGKRVFEVLADEISEEFRAGRLRGFDGITFDVLWYAISGGKADRGADVNGDGVIDNGLIEGKQVYGIGVVEFMRILRQKLGNNILILGDGFSKKHNRAFHINNGIESEGWPTFRDHKIEEWSGGLNRHYFWRRNGHAPQFNYIVHKYDAATQGVPIPFSTHRLVFAAATFTDSAITYVITPQPDETGLFPVWDEFRMGAERKLGWLGAPKGEAVHLADQSPDLLQGKMESFSSESLRNIKPINTTCEVRDKKLECRGAKDKVSFLLPGIPVVDGSLTIRLRGAGKPMNGYPPEVARVMEVKLAAEDFSPEKRGAKRGKGDGDKDGKDNQMSFVGSDFFTSRFFFPSLDKKSVDVVVTVEGAEPVTIQGITAHGAADLVYREFDNGLVLANPGLKPAQFDLNTLFPGKKYRRLKASPAQDVTVNNGADVSGVLTLSGKDALFLVRIK